MERIEADGNIKYYLKLQELHQHSQLKSSNPQAFEDSQPIMKISDFLGKRKQSHLIATLVIRDQ